MKQLQHETISFNDFMLDLTRGCLLRGAEEVKLRPKSFDVLKHLVENHGRLVSKDELIQAVWPNTAVTDDSLVQCLIEVRRALGNGGLQIVKTVPRRGYIFDTEVIRHDSAEQVRVYTEEIEGVQVAIEGELESERPVTTDGITTRVIPEVATLPVTAWQRSRRSVYLVITCATLVAAAALMFYRSGTRGHVQVAPIRSLAVLPFKSLNQEAKEDYLGLGIATDIITKISQSSELTVRPTSAVRKYVNQEVDALAAARELKVDAVLDSTFMHVGDQLRVSVNLLRVEDGTSLWAERFDERFTDIFAIQDKVSRQVAQRLHSKLDPAAQARITKRYTSNPEAYNYYAKAMYHFGNIWPDPKTRSDSALAVDLFKKAIDLDPKYALAHAQLGSTYARTAVFQEDNPSLIEQAKQELAIAETLDPQLAEVHLARYFIEFSQYEGWQVETAMRELRLAQQLDPNVGRIQLADFYSHIGLEKQAVEVLETALQIDPNNDQLKSQFITEYALSARPDEALESRKRFFNRGPDLSYYLDKRMVKEAAPLVEQAYQKDPGSDVARSDQALLLALQGKHQEAEAAVPAILEKLRKNRGYHHFTYSFARIYALGGKSDEALKWLQVTVQEGFPCFPLFERDSFLDTIRKDPDFIRFMAEMRTRWESYQRQFG